MAIHNELRRASDLQRGVKIFSGLDSAEGGIERLGETLTPVLDPWSRPEIAYLRRERLAAGWTYVAAGGAGNISAASLGNPDPTRFMMVIEEIIINVTTTGSVYLCNTGLQLVNIITTKGSRDGRWSPTAAGDVPNAVVSNKNNDATTPGNAIAAVPITANQPFVWRQPWVLGRNGIMTVRSATANVAMTVSWCWRERTLIPGENS